MEMRMGSRIISVLILAILLSFTSGYFITNLKIEERVLDLENQVSSLNYEISSSKKIVEYVTSESIESSITQNTVTKTVTITNRNSHPMDTASIYKVVKNSVVKNSG